ncbi:MAG TPA: helix-turn-helix domain-containing protein [Phycisphaerae bacterium]|nr:helix-turn-helix domain-containing protein [Phycisphaerae bacterium]
MYSREKVQEFLEAGLSLDEIASRLGVTRRWVRFLAKELGHPADPPPPPGHIPIREAAAMFGMTQQRLRQACVDGEVHHADIPWGRKGRRYYVTPEAVQSWLDSRKARARAWVRKLLQDRSKPS